MSRPAVEKLPLAVRRNVRDEWETQKDEFQTNLSTVLGTPWTIDVNPNAIFAYAEAGSYAAESLGDCIREYVSSAVDAIRSFVESRGGPTAQDDINSIVHAHVLTLDADPSGKVLNSGSDVSEDGKLRILFQPERLGVNISDALEHLHQSLNDAPAPPSSANSSSAITLIGRADVRSSWESQVDSLTRAIREKVKDDQIVLEPNFEAVARILKEKGDAREWERYMENLGSFIYGYFNALSNALSNQGFESDDMLQEGFQEAVTGKKVVFRVVEKLEKKIYNECVIQDGILYLQTDPSHYGANLDDIAEDLLSLL